LFRAARSDAAMSRALRKAAPAAAWLACYVSIAHAQDALTTDTPEAPVKSLGVVVVTGAQPTSLPTQIPTTIEGITGRQVEATINATDSEDALKYFPSLLVRKRYIGDYDHAVLSTRASGTGNSARSLVYADGILLSNLLGNGAFFTPRWGVVTPEEIERVDVLYGPFSAAYPGNSVGAVVDYVTRMPRQFEAHAKVAGFTQDYRLYNTDATYSGYQASASLGSRHGAWSWWVNVNRLDSEGHPLVFPTRTVASGTVGGAGTPVTGAVLDRNRSNQDWYILGTSSQAQTVQEHAKAKVAWQVGADLRASYTLGWWDNDTERRPQSYLRDAAGNTVYAGTINIDGRSFTLAATDFPQTRERLQHLIHGLSVKRAARGTWDWEVAASRYDYAKDLVRTPTIPLPGADAGGAGRITDQKGTGWLAYALKGTWRPGAGDVHVADFGYQDDHYMLRNVVSNTSDWISGGAESTFSAFRGDTGQRSLYAQDTWRFAPHWKTVLGLRVEQWRAWNGATTQRVGTPPALTTAVHGEREETALSPKAAIGLQAGDDWLLKVSTGRAVRFPTVSELFQGGVSAIGTVTNGDPNLKPETSWTYELSSEHKLANATVRATPFYEDTKDALYSQTNVTVTPNVTNIQNVDRIRTYGMELVYQGVDVLVAGFDLAASVTYAVSKIVENDNAPSTVDKYQPRVPIWRATLLASYRPTERLSATLGMRYSGRQYNTLDNSDPNGFAYQGTSKFFTADVRVRYRFAERWTASAGVDNVNNYKYWNFHPYPQRTWLADLRFDL
jgi:iron complex outermembrane receptor protein